MLRNTLAFGLLLLILGSMLTTNNVQAQQKTTAAPMGVITSVEPTKVRAGDTITIKGTNLFAPGDTEREIALDGPAQKTISYLRSNKLYQAQNGEQVILLTIPRHGDYMGYWSVTLTPLEIYYSKGVWIEVVSPIDRVGVDKNTKELFWETTWKSQASKSGEFRLRTDPEALVYQTNYNQGNPSRLPFIVGPELVTRSIYASAGVGLFGTETQPFASSVWRSDVCSEGITTTLILASDKLSYTIGNPSPSLLYIGNNDTWKPFTNTVTVEAANVGRVEVKKSPRSSSEEPICAALEWNIPRSAPNPTSTPTNMVPSVEQVDVAGPFGPTYQLRIHGKNLFSLGITFKLRSQVGEELWLAPGYVWPGNSPNDLDYAAVNFPARLTGHWEVWAQTNYGESNKMPIKIGKGELYLPSVSRTW